MSVKISKKDMTVEYDGCTFMFKPRNAGTLEKLSELGEEKHILPVARMLITGWDGPVDADTGEKVPFSADSLQYMDIKDLGEVISLITAAYGIESEQEGNSPSTSTT